MLLSAKSSEAGTLGNDVGNFVYPKNSFFHMKKSQSKVAPGPLFGQ